MLPPTPGAPRLDVGAALREGWRAFLRAPWVLVGFLLVAMVLGLGLALIENALSPPPGALPPPRTPGLLLCQLASWALSLWTVVGLVRGAWIALEGRRPSFGELLRWDGAAIGRVLLASLLLTLILALIALPLLGVMATAVDRMVDIDFPLGGPPVLRSFLPTPGAVLQLTLAALLLLAVFTYAQVNQHFLVQLASLRGTGALGSLRAGRAVVDPQWWPTLGLVALESLLLLAGSLALLLGLFVAVPLVFCVSTAAYRQLFGGEPHAGGRLPAA
jgi:hypothetical protein